MHFAEQVSAQNNWKPVVFEEEAIAELQKFPWAGNIRELRNAVERLMLLANDGAVTPETVQFGLPQTDAGSVHWRVRHTVRTRTAF